MAEFQCKTTFDLNSEIIQLNYEIVAAHNKHYENSPTGLLKPNESPNGNTMYHLYNDGEITYQKGGWAYGQRSVFQDGLPVNNMKKLQLNFPKDMGVIGGETYAILTQKECQEFRNKMISMLRKFEENEKH